MQIQRYLLKDKKVGEPFGEHFVEPTYDFDWFMGLNNRIGITPNPSTEAELFYSGFLVMDDTLLLTPLEDKPRIRREYDSYARMSGKDSGRTQIKDLIRLIQGCETTHAYQTSSFTDGRYPNILTFSQSPPLEGLYCPGKIIPVKINQTEIDEDIETKRLLKEIDEAMRRLKAPRLKIA